MIRSAQEEHSLSWKEESYSSEIDGKMLESAFSSISISGMASGGNRPPALSASSISSIGEDFNHKGGDFSNYYGNHVGVPSSPLSNASASRSHFYSNSALDSPIATSVRLDGNMTPNYQSDVSNSFTNKSGSQHQNYSSFDTALYAGNMHQSLPTFKEHIDPVDFSYGPRVGSSHPEDRAQSFQDLMNFSKAPRSSADASESGGGYTIGNWPPNARSTHSLNNMGSVDENEQYFGNRARATSATATLGYRRPQSLSGSFSNTTVYEEDLNNQSSGHGYTRSIDNFQVPAGPRTRAVSHEENHHHQYNNRQRVMSADAVHNSPLRNAVMYNSSVRMGSNSFASHSSNPYMEQQNRPRSLSSGNANYPSNPNYRSSVPPPTSYMVDYNGTPSPYYVTGGAPVMMQPGQPNDLQYSNHHANQSSGRAYMYEQHRMQEMGHANQDRIIHARQPQGSSEQALPYYQNVDSQYGMQQATPRTVYTVKFKRSQKNFFLSDQIKGDIKIGSYVKVEADRGEDLGIVLSRIPVEKFNPGARLNTPNLDIPDLQLKRITRLASDADITLLGLKEEEEAELLKICRSKSLQRGLPMNVVDAEYQFDRHKLTFFFEANCRIDFRELVRDLFSIYKTRIWMQQIDKVSGSIASALGTGTVPIQVRD